MIREIDDSGTIQVDEKTVQDVLNMVVPMALPFILETAGSIPMPALGPYTLAATDIWVMDEAAVFLGIAGNLAGGN